MMKLRIPKPHQVEAIESTLKHFDSNPNGKLIMPCGSGKTLTAIWAIQRMDFHRIVIVLPNLTLESQTLNQWIQELTFSTKLYSFLCVCSDETVADGIRSGYNIMVTTNKHDTSNFLKNNENVIVLTTYQSGHVLADASMEIEYDIIVFDEAHHTAGLKGKKFSYLMYDKHIKANKRLYMTATSRFYNGVQDDVVSMDDASIYGGNAYRLSIREAINRGILCDYNIYTTGCSDSEVKSVIKSNPNIIDRHHNINDEMLIVSMAVASVNAYKTIDIKRSVSYHTTIERAKRFARIVSILAPEIQVFHVNGNQPIDERKNIIQQFESSEKAILTNSKALIEGVDIPDLDGIIYADSKSTSESIIQSMGRALRNLTPGKIAKIIIPISTDRKNRESVIKHMKFIISSIAVDDEEIMSEFKSIIKGINKRKRLKSIESIAHDVDDVSNSVYVKIHDRSTIMRKFEFNGRLYSMKELSKLDICVVSYYTIVERLSRSPKDWTVIDALTTPPIPYKRDYTDQEIIDSAKKFKTVNAWKVNDHKMYHQARKRGKEFYKMTIAHMLPRIRVAPTFTDKEIIDAAKKYNTVKDWKNCDPKTYNAAKIQLL